MNQCTKRTTPYTKGKTASPTCELLGGVIVSPVKWTSCTQVLSGTEGDPSVLPTKWVNSRAYFFSVPVGWKCDCVQTVAASLTGAGFGFPGTLKSTVALQNSGSIVACTVHLPKTCDAMLSNARKHERRKIQTERSATCHRFQMA